MNNKIRKSYSNIKMTEESKEKVYQQILETMDDSQKQNKVLRGRKAVLPAWKMGIAACLAAALIIPSGVYAAGKLYEYMTVNIEKNNYQATIELHKPKNTQDVSGTSNPEMSVAQIKNAQMKDTETKEDIPVNHYIQVKADFGPDYKPDKIFDGMYSYNHKDGFDAGKDFCYTIIYMDESSDAILNLYDQISMKEIEINGHRALFCESNVVQGSRYSSDYDTDYTLNVYVFYDEYEYIINYRGMQGLGKKQLISLAEKATVTEVSKKDASNYEFLSEFANADTIKPENDSTKKEITLPVKEKNDIVEHSGLTYQVTNVTVSSRMEDYDTTDPKQAPFLDQCQGLWDKNGKLKPYIRENIKYGDGISEPEKTVTGEKTIQPKMVYVTMKVSGGGTFQLPSIDFFEKDGSKYYDTRQYRQYNRPEKIEFALVDFMPCYFKETNGGKGYWIKNMTGKEQVFHFAYIVDEDMTDSMYLCLDNGTYPYNGPYIDISQ